MKKLFIIATLPLATTAFAQGPTTQDALVAIDNICGDTWCEGDFGFRFNQLEIVNGTAHLSFDLSLVSEHEDEIWFPASCTLPGFASPEAMVRKVGAFYALEDEFYSAVSECIGTEEDRVRGLIDAMIPANGKATACRLALQSHFVLSLSEEELAAECGKARIFVSSLTPGAREYILTGKMERVGYYFCEFRETKAGDWSILECSSRE